MKINSIIDLVKDLDTSRQTKNLNKLLIRILLHLQVEFSRKEDLQSLMLENIDALASGEGGIIPYCVGIGSVDCPINHVKVYAVTSYYSLEEHY